MHNSFIYNLKQHAHGSSDDRHSLTRNLYYGSCKIICVKRRKVFNIDGLRSKLKKMREITIHLLTFLWLV